MKATIYFPYTQGDAKYDYLYQGRDISSEEYAKLNVAEYNKHKVGVDLMMNKETGRFTHNISKNGFKKKRRNFKKVTYSFFECPCRLMNPKTQEITFDELMAIADGGKKSILMMQLDRGCVKQQGELNVELNSWVRQSRKILTEPRLSKEERIFHLPKKDIQIYDDDHNELPILLEGCKIVQTKNVVTTFVILINSVKVGVNILDARKISRL